MGAMTVPDPGRAQVHSRTAEKLMATAFSKALGEHTELEWGQWQFGF